MGFHHFSPWSQSISLEAKMLSRNGTRSAIAIVAFLIVGCRPSSGSAVRKSMSAWNASVDTSKLDGAVKTYLTHIQGDHALTIRIRNGGIEEFYVATPTTVMESDGGVPVRFKFDSGAVHSETWYSAASNDGIFAPDAFEFLKQLQHASTLVFEYSPLSQAPKEVRFTELSLPAFVVHILDSTSSARARAKVRDDSIAEVRAKRREAERIRKMVVEQGVDPCSLRKEDQAAIGMKCQQ
jgi:hypothetical protein